MEGLTDEQYKQQYDEAVAKMDAAEGKPAITEEVKTEPVAKVEPDKVEPEKVVAQVEEKAEPVKTEAEELRLKLEKAEKALIDTKAWGTKNAQRLAAIERERLLAERESSKPGILEANPELVDAIRYVQNDPTPQIQQEEAKDKWIDVVNTAHPGIFENDIDPELHDALLDKLSKMDVSDPLVAIREITAEKLAFAERQIAKRFTIEAEKQSKKNAMSMPNVGSLGERNVNAELAEVERINNMSDAEFAKEVRKAKGF